MALREVKPLDAKQWKQLTDDLKKGPTPEQVEFARESIEYFRRLEQERQKE